MRFFFSFIIFVLFTFSFSEFYFFVKTQAANETIDVCVIDHKGSSVRGIVVTDTKTNLYNSYCKSNNITKTVFTITDGGFSGSAGTSFYNHLRNRCLASSWKYRVCCQRKSDNKYYWSESCGTQGIRVADVSSCVISVSVNKVFCDGISENSASPPPSDPNSITACLIHVARGGSSSFITGTKTGIYNQYCTDLNTNFLVSEPNSSGDCPQFNFACCRYYSLGRSVYSLAQASSCFGASQVAGSYCSDQIKTFVKVGNTTYCRSIKP